ncbi:MAG: hypothetical protein ABIL52_08270 [candidate division WOR-3 bacterium]
MLNLLILTYIEAIKIEKVEDIYAGSILGKPYKLISIMPEWNENPVDSSIVFVFYTKREIVIHSKNFQKGVNATSKRRDAIGLKKGQEDNFSVIIAPFGKGKDVYYISINPLGTIYDAMFTSYGEVEWDGKIVGNTKITDYGWDATIIIPFSSISYSETEWGIQFLRFITKSVELQVLYPTKSLNYLQELAEINLDFNYIIKPKGYSINFYPDGRYTVENNEGSFSYGFTGETKFGAKSSLNITYKPDYSEIDVDMFKFDLKRLPINYPEKRIFFTEGLNYITMPYSLIRTRNFVLPKVGTRFFSTQENASFIFYYIQDSLLNNVSFFRSSYNPFQTTTLGFFLLGSQMGYNLASGDFSHYFEKIKSQLSIQFTNRLDNNSNIYYFSFDRMEKPGLSFGVNFASIDSFILSPINYALINFEGINELYSYIFYHKTKKDFTFIPYLEYSLGINKYDYNQRIYYNFAGSLYFQITKFLLPLIMNLGFIRNELEYLKEISPDINTQSTLFSITFSYFLSAWNQGSIQYVFGNYLGSSYDQIYFDMKFPFFNLYNFGLSINRINSIMDSLIVFENYGEIFLFRNFYFKPYLSYKIDRMNKIDGSPSEFFIINLVIGYEPIQYTKLFIAIRREYNVKDKYKLEEISSKYVIKAQLGLSF